MLSKLASNNEEKEKRKPKTTELEYKLMLQFLEILENFELIVGNATARLPGVVAGALLTKGAGYERLARWVNERSHGSNWDWTDAQNRLRAYRDKYFKTKRELKNNAEGKFNIPEELRLQGWTINKLLDSKCFGYERMDLLFGERQNVTPSFTAEPSRPAPVANLDVDEDSEVEATSESF